MGNSQKKQKIEVAQAPPSEKIQNCIEEKIIGHKILSDISYKSLDEIQKFQISEFNEDQMTFLQKNSSIFDSESQSLDLKINQTHGHVQLQVKFLNSDQSYSEINFSKESTSVYSKKSQPNENLFQMQSSDQNKDVNQKYQEIEDKIFVGSSDSSNKVQDQIDFYNQKQLVTVNDKAYLKRKEYQAEKLKIEKQKLSDSQNLLNALNQKIELSKKLKILLNQSPASYKDDKKSFQNQSNDQDLQNHKQNKRQKLEEFNQNEDEYFYQQISNKSKENRAEIYQKAQKETLRQQHEKPQKNNQTKNQSKFVSEHRYIQKYDNKLSDFEDYETPIKLQKCQDFESSIDSFEQKRSLKYKTNFQNHETSKQIFRKRQSNQEKLSRFENVRSSLEESLKGHQYQQESFQNWKKEDLYFTQSKQYDYNKNNLHQKYKSFQVDFKNDYDNQRSYKRDSVHLSYLEKLEKNLNSNEFEKSKNQNYDYQPYQKNDYDYKKYDSSYKTQYRNKLISNSGTQNQYENIEKKLLSMRFSNPGFYPSAYSNSLIQKSNI